MNTKTQTTTLSLSGESRAAITGYVTASRALDRNEVKLVDLLIADVNRITWSAQYRKPSSLKSCSKFAQVNLREEKATVCSEDSASTGKMMGVIDSLRKKFK